MPFKNFGIHLKNAWLRRMRDAAYRQKCLALLLLLVGIFLLLPTAIQHIAPPIVLTPTPTPMPMPTPVATPDPTLFEPFPFPEKLTPQVVFWKKIFTEYATTQVVIHDNWYVNVVYEVINLRSAEFETEQDGWKAVNAAQEKYEKLLASMALQWETPEKMSATEQAVYALFQNQPESAYFEKKAAQDRIRAQVGQADRFKAGLIRAGGYLDAMKKIVAAAGLPENIVYLPMIESTFNPLAESFVGAAGAWQFMRATGLEYHLAINYMLDERRDPLKATNAAAQMLAHNYEVMQSWPLAITAYNHGLQGIKNAADQVGSTDLGEIVEKYDGPRFGFASRNFYAEFLAAVAVCVKYPDYFGQIELAPPLALTQVTLPDYVSVKTLEKYTTVKAADIVELNPALHKAVFEPGNFLPKNVQINVLLEQQAAFAAGYAAIPDALKYSYVAVKAKHRVKTGQTLASIAKQYQTTMNALAKLNKLAGRGKIRVGQVLKIPGDYVALARKNDAPPEPQPPAAPAATKHRVQKGQTLAAIAKQYHTTLAALAQFNQLARSRKIKVGQMLKIPDSDLAESAQLVAQKNDGITDAPAAASVLKVSRRKNEPPRAASVQAKTKHRVAKGQTLEDIAKQHNTTVKAITQFNKITNPRKIKVGQVLHIPPG